ncbi:MAG: GNAT family N-acetyltransferase [Anaerolineae bacterium]|nr:GNAT family N-acetyltransferase [Anaerolineae bacterium]
MDVQCVRELLADYFGKTDGGGYRFIVYRRDGRVLGMACYGATPLTEGTFDLYWLAVAPTARREGIGRILLERVEADVRREGARMLVVETSGTPGYEPARRFYLARGYHRQATIPDFYAPGDDLVIYVKRFDTPGG